MLGDFWKRWVAPGNARWLLETLGGSWKRWVAPENTILLLPKWLTGYNSAKSYLLSVS
jgi:hypothetical protein